MAPAHRGGQVKEYNDRRTKEGHRVVKEIDGVLTYVLQVCNHVANKEIKALIKKELPQVPHLVPEERAGQDS